MLIILIKAIIINKLNEILAKTIYCLREIIYSSEISVSDENCISQNCIHHKILSKTSFTKKETLIF